MWISMVLHINFFLLEKPLFYHPESLRQFFNFKLLSSMHTFCVKTQNCLGWLLAASLYNKFQPKWISFHPFFIENVDAIVYKYIFQLLFNHMKLKLTTSTSFVAIRQLWNVKFHHMYLILLWSICGLIQMVVLIIQTVINMVYDFFWRQTVV